jgi:hypothetical protein
MATLDDEDLSSDFPRLSKSNHTVTSPEDGRYNCVAHAVGSASDWWWPAPASEPGNYWPRGVVREPTLSAFTTALATVGFDRCADGSLETGFEKLALYADLNDEITHAARSVAGDRWTSKLGRIEDIEHTIDALDGPGYGRIVAFFRRELKPDLPR